MKPASSSCLQQPPFAMCENGLLWIVASIQHSAQQHGACAVHICCPRVSKGTKLYSSLFSRSVVCRASFRHPERGPPRRGARIHSDSWGTETPEYDSLALGVDTFAWVRPAVLPSQPLPARPHAGLPPSMHSISPAPFSGVCGCLRQK